jgi:hypothetical protein
MVPPIAMRPAEIREERLREYLDDRASLSPAARETQLVGTDEFDELLGLVSE